MKSENIPIRTYSEASLLKGTKAIKLLISKGINANSVKEEEVLSRIRNIRVTVRLYELGVGSTLLNNELL